MSAPLNALAALDANLKDRAERAARYGKKADKEAERRGFRNPAGDRKADFERHLLQQLSAARAAFAELIEAAGGITGTTHEDGLVVDFDSLADLVTALIGVKGGAA